MHGGGSVDKAGLQEGDIVLAVNGTRLSHGLLVGSLVPHGGQGATLTLSVMRIMPAVAEPATATSGAATRRTRAPPERLGGMATLEGVRIFGDNAQTHMQRLTRVFAGQTAESI